MIGSAIFLVLSIYLFFSPEILYGIIPPNLSIVKYVLAKGIDLDIAEDDKHEVGKEKKAILSDESALYYAKLIENHITANDCFRQQGITVNNLAAELDISPRIISTVINQYHGQRFSDFINTYRVNYLITRFAENNWGRLSLEGLSQEAGFASRTAFFMAFKKHTGLNPTEYLQKITSGRAIDSVNDHPANVN